ncbi:Uncharacterised protein [Mycobacteroides abscessus subsp. abscessus]|nr:Uncharacterised protein [Mycobacteroides abscessus subsp. abscessus]
MVANTFTSGAYRCQWIGSSLIAVPLLVRPLVTTAADVLRVVHSRVTHGRHPTTSQPPDPAHGADTPRRSRPPK